VEGEADSMTTDHVHDRRDGSQSSGDCVQACRRTTVRTGSTGDAAEVGKGTVVLFMEFKEGNKYDFEFQGINFMNASAAHPGPAKRGSPGRADLLRGNRYR
jgi:hypothetical protein